MLCYIFLILTARSASFSLNGLSWNQFFYYQLISHDKICIRILGTSTYSYIPKHIHPTPTEAEGRLKQSRLSASVGVELIALDEERLVLSKMVVHFSFTYSVLRGLSYNHSLRKISTQGLSPSGLLSSCRIQALIPQPTNQHFLYIQSKLLVRKKRKKVNGIMYVEKED